MKKTALHTGRIISLIHCAFNYCITVLIFLFIFSIKFYAQVPPNPKLIEKINSGVVALPHLQDKDNLTISKTLEKSSPDALQKNNLIPPSGKFNLLVVLVDFSDKPHGAKENYYDTLLFSDIKPSVKKYFSEVSYGKLTLQSFDLPSHTKWIRAPRPYSYYTSGGDYGLGSYPNNTQKLAEDVISIIDSSIDFSKYDNNHDGVADNILIIHSGQGAEFTGSADDIWSHSTSMGAVKTNDNVDIYRYVMLPEYYLDNKGDLTIGPVSHELGHLIFNLPELYDGDYSSYGLGKWSLMAYGCWNGVSKQGGDMPAHPDPLCRIRMGFAAPRVISDNTMNMEIKPVETDSAGIIKIWKDNDFTKGEYYLIENMQRVGSDESLPGEGLLIYHVAEGPGENTQEWYPGHTTNGHYLIALEQADNMYGLEKKTSEGEDGDPFPGRTNKSSFNLQSFPDSRSYSGEDSKVAVQNIRNAGQFIFADVYFSTKKYNLTVTSPSGGERLISGTAQKLKWTSADVNKLNIEYNINSRTEWIPIVMNYDASAGEYTWTVPYFDLAFCKIRITDPAYPSLNYVSDFFAVQNEIKTAKVPGPGDIVFTQVLKGAGSNPPYYGLFEFITLRDFDLTSLKLAWQTPKFLSDTLIFVNYVDFSSESPLFWKCVPKGTFVRYRVNNLSTTVLDSAGKIITIYKAWQRVYDWTIGNNVLAYTGSDEKPTYIAGIALQFDWLFSSGGKKPDTPSDILLRWDSGYYGDTISGSAEFLRQAITDTSRWKRAYNTDFVSKSITILGPTASSDDLKDQPDTYVLKQNYPNPFNPVTTIRYSLPEQTDVELKIYDMLGRELIILVNNVQSAGEYKVKFDGSSLPSGIYVYTIHAGEYRASRKLMLLK